MKAKKWMTGLMAAVLLLCCAVMGGCAQKEKSSVKTDEDKMLASLTEDQFPVATITFKGYDTPVVVRLDPTHALNTVKNFIYLAESDFYTNKTIHRVTDFCIQGGSTSGESGAVPEYHIEGEFSENGYDNPLTHERGTISMARAADFDSASTQFFICTKKVSALDGKYAAFGTVLSGMNTVLAISMMPHDGSNGSRDGKPLDDIVIASVKVDTKGITYPAPEKKSAK